MAKFAPLGKQKELYDELLAVAEGRYFSTLQQGEIVAVASHLVGKLVARMDMRIYTVDEVLAVVICNIREGIREAAERVEDKRGIHLFSL